MNDDQISKRIESVRTIYMTEVRHLVDSVE